MHIVAIVGGLFLILATLVDGFETVVLPRRVTRRLRLSRLFFHYSWGSWAWLAHWLHGGADKEGSSQRDRLLGVYGPLALILLLSLWATALLFGFALVQWGLVAPLTAPGGAHGFGTLLYLSGVTFFTLGFGDVVPLTAPGRVVAVFEVATGFSFLALIIGYLPTIYGAFSRREVNITLLDARAGSPPSAAELLRRHHRADDLAALDQLLREWERWAAELLESHLSYPVLSYYRSQHEHLSWLASLTVILDTCTLLLVGVRCPEGDYPTRQARLTFAVARHALTDLNQILAAAPHPPVPDRLPPAALTRLRDSLAEVGLQLRVGADAEHWLAETRRLYEPYAHALATSLLFTLPAWLPSDNADDWQTTAWDWQPARLPIRDESRVESHPLC